ncbi:Phytanoyl-CoA dioxygenase [Lasiodiplodia theobromae]|uniref:Phytanoyl-CoA dioxygenase n=1 Tax=Lasiodiplodia theobromae TaxID=45133 RepID=UPI0015C3C7F3|nr:Phytanoyl-CoA dioxygenase [Lasiodiplodia theobromae]KAF4539439.1 Phytanoyl-CoA dioxygenase [Lasiodiplodia theobromae]
MPAARIEKYGPEVQKVPADAPLEDILYLLKRDGGVFVKNLVSEEDVDKACEDVKERLDADVEWEGAFFPTMRIGPGGKAQPLHRDDYISHNHHTEIDEWDDERDRNRETAVGLFVAGSRVTKENGGTQFIPRSHLWGTDRDTPPRVDQCIFADMEKGDAFIMLASAYHGGGDNVTKDQRRMLFSTFVVRGYLRQEENQFLAVPKDVVKGYDRPIQEFIGYSMSEPACGYLEQLDPIYALNPELLKGTAPKDF